MGRLIPPEAAFKTLLRESKVTREAVHKRARDARAAYTAKQAPKPPAEDLLSAFGLAP